MYTLAELQKNWPLQPEQALACLQELVAQGCFTVEASQLIIEEGHDAGLTILQAFARRGATDPHVFALLLEKCPEVVRAHSFNTPIQHGMHKGKSILWWLALAATVDKSLKIFLTLINNYPTAVTHEGLLTQSQGVADAGISALWWLAWLASAAGNYHPEAFLKVLELYPAAITPDGLNAQSQAGGDKGQSVLWLLAAASVEEPKAFLQLIERFPLAITAEGLSAQVPEGVYRGTSALWWLARAAENHQPEPILKLLENLPLTITAEALNAQAIEGEEEAGTSALWSLAKATDMGDPKPFLKVLEQYPAVMTSAALTTQPQAGFDAGKMMLWWLAAAGEHGNTSIFLKILSEHSTLITPALFTEQAQRGMFAGVSVLWWLAKAASNGSPAAFLRVMEEYPAAITLETITAPGQDGSARGKSPLWWLASAASNGRPEAFLKLLQQYPAVITAEGLTAQAQEDLNNQGNLDEGKSPLWLLAKAVAKGYPEAFTSLLDNMPRKITPEGLNTLARKGEDLGKSALRLLAESCANGQVVFFLKFTEKMRHVISADAWFGNAILSILIPVLDIASLKQLFLRPCDKVSLIYLGFIFNTDKAPANKRTALLALYRAKNQFLTQLENCEKDLRNYAKIHDEQVKILIDLAQQAAKAGYETALYEVASFLEYASLKKDTLMKHTALEYEGFEQAGDKRAAEKLTEAQSYQREANYYLTQAYEHYLNAPVDTYQYGTKYMQIASHYYDKADECEQEAAKKQCLEKALKAALRLEKTDRQRMLQMIAKSYICPERLGLKFDFIPAYWLSMINADTTIEACFAIFEEKKEQLMAGKAMEALKEKHEALAQEFALILQQRDALMARVAQLESGLMPPVQAALMIATADPKQDAVAITPGYSNSQVKKRKFSGALMQEGSTEKTGQERVKAEAASVSR